MSERNVEARSVVVIMAAALLLAIAPACVASRLECPCISTSSPGAVVVPVTAPAAVPSSTDGGGETKSASARGLCWGRGRPSPVASPLPQAASPTCARFDAAALAAVEARVRKDYVVLATPSKLVVDWGCDLAYGTLRDVYFEDSSGHGGGMRLVRFRREGGSRVAVTMIESAHGLDVRTALRTAELDARAFDPVVATSRVALLTMPHLVRLADGSKGTSSPGSSKRSDVHLRLTLVDREGHVTDRGFTGYVGTSVQDTLLPVEIASEPFTKLLASLSFTTQPSFTDDERRMFTERFVVTMSGRPSWWIKERYIALATSLGTIDAVPHLASLVEANASAKGEGSEPRVLAGALAAIAAITGWDPRLDANGTPRPDRDAAAAVVEECIEPH